MGAFEEAVKLLNQKQAQTTPPMGAAVPSPLPTPIPTPQGNLAETDILGNLYTGAKEGITGFRDLYDVASALTTQPGREAIYQNLKEIPAESYLKGAVKEGFGTAAGAATAAIPVVGPFLSPLAYAGGRTGGNALLQALGLETTQTPKELAETAAREAGGAYSGEFITRGLGLTAKKGAKLAPEIKIKLKKTLGPVTPEIAQEEVGKVFLEQGYTPGLTKAVTKEAQKAVPTTAAGLTTAETFQAGGAPKQQTGMLASLEDKITSELPSQQPTYTSFVTSQAESRNQLIAGLGKGEDLNPADSGELVKSAIKQAQDDSQAIVSQAYNAIPQDVVIDVRKGNPKGKIAKLEKKYYKTQFDDAGEKTYIGLSPPGDLLELIDNFYKAKALLTPGELQKYYQDFGFLARKYGSVTNLDNTASAAAKEMRTVIENRLRVEGRLSKQIKKANQIAFQHAKTFYDGELANIVVSDKISEKYVDTILASQKSVNDFFEIVGKNSPAHDAVKAQYISDVLQNIRKDASTINQLKKNKYINEKLFGEEAQIFDDLIKDADVRTQAKKAANIAGGSATAPRSSKQIAQLFPKAITTASGKIEKGVGAFFDTLGSVGLIQAGITGSVMPLLAGAPAAINLLRQGRNDKIASNLGQAITEALTDPKKFRAMLLQAQKAKNLELRSKRRAVRAGETLQQAFTKAAPVGRRVGAYSAETVTEEEPLMQDDELRNYFMTQGQ